MYLRRMLDGLETHACRAPFDNSWGEVNFSPSRLFCQGAVSRRAAKGLRST